MRGAQERGKHRRRTGALGRPRGRHEGPPPGQNARLRGGVKIPRPHRERDRMAPVSRPTPPRQSPLRPYSFSNPSRGPARMPVYGAGWRRKLGRDAGFYAPQPPRQFPLHPYTGGQPRLGYCLSKTSTARLGSPCQSVLYESEKLRPSAATVCVPVHASLPSCTAPFRSTNDCANFAVTSNANERSSTGLSMIVYVSDPPRTVYGYGFPSRRASNSTNVGLPLASVPS